LSAKSAQAPAGSTYHADGAALGELRAYVDDMWRAALASFSDAVAKKGQDK
jgi:hypothetical protein